MFEREETAMIGQLKRICLCGVLALSVATFPWIAWSDAGVAASSQLQGKSRSTSEQRGGIFSLRGPRDEDFTKAPELEFPFVAGLSARIAWSDLEPKQGQYDWRLLEQAKETAASHKKPLMLRVTAGMLSPDWVYKLEGVGAVTFTKEDVSWLKPGETVRMPVPWAEGYLKAWESCLVALGKKIHDWPELYCVQMTGGGFIGELHLPKTSATTMKQWQEAGASEEKVNAMWRRIITAYDKNMPAHVGISLNLALPLPGYETGTVVREWALREYPGHVWFQQNGLSGVKEKGAYSEILISASATTTVGYQMAGTVEGSEAGGRKIVWPRAFQRAIEDKCSYLEVYQVDVNDPKRKDDLIFLANGLEKNNESKLKQK